MPKRKPKEEPIDPRKGKITSEMALEFKKFKHNPDSELSQIKDIIQSGVVTQDVERFDHLSMITRIYFTPVSEDTSEYTFPFEQVLKTKNEQPAYRSRIEVTEEWMDLDSMWVKDPGMVIIHNKEGKFTSTIPDDEQKANAAKKILEVAFKGHEEVTWLVHPQGVHFGFPCSVPLRVRSQFGTIQFSWVVLPR